MLISTTEGDFYFDSEKEAISFIKNISHQKEELWISNGNKYPCLAVLINGNYAAINYFEKENGEMWLSYNKNNTTEITFTAGGEDWTPTADTIISIEDAVNCISEFLNNYKKPLCIQWQEL